MRAVVLVGGEGTRLRPLTLTTPKQMLPVAGRSMIERVLAHLGRHGVDGAVLSLGYRPDAFLAAFPDGTAAGVKVEYAVEEEPLDTAGAIRFAADEAGIGERFIAVNGDVLTDLDVGKLIELHERSGATATISLTPVEDPSSFGVVPTEDDGRVIAFVEKPPRHAAPTNMVSAGTYVLEPQVLDRIEPGRKVSIERDVFPELAAEGGLFALSSPAYWMDAGTPEKYLAANRDLLSGIRPGRPTPGARVARPGVWTIGRPELDGEISPSSLACDRARVAPGARVADAVLGEGARVETGAWVVGSVLLAGAVVGAGSVVEDSILGEQAEVGEEASVRGLSVVGSGTTIEPGTRLEGAKVPAGAP